MKVTVIGVGFIGSSIVKKLSEKHEVTVIDKSTHNLTEIVESSNDAYIVGKLRNILDSEFELPESDVIIHLAGSKYPDYQNDLITPTELELRGTLNILKKIPKYSWLIYASSFYVYDGHSSSSTVYEWTPLIPDKMHIFGFNKYVCEQLIQRMAREKQLRTTILRFGPAYGEDERCSCLIYDFLRTGLFENKVEVWGRGRRQNQYTYVEDIAEAVKKVIETKTYGVYNVISPERMSIRQIANMISEMYGFEVVHRLDKREGYSLPYISPYKLCKQFDFKFTTLEEGIKITYERMKERWKNVLT